MKANCLALAVAAAALFVAPPAFAHPHGPLSKIDLEEQAIWLVRRMVTMGGLDASWRDAKVIYSQPIEPAGNWLVRVELAGAAEPLCLTMNAIGGLMGKSADCAPTL